MENPTPAPCQVLTFSVPPTREKRDRLNAAIKEGVARNDGKPLTCFTALAKWHVTVGLRMLQSEE